MWQLLNPANWSKKYSLAFAVVSMLSVMATNGSDITWPQATVKCVVALTAGLITLRYLQVQGAIDAGGNGK